MNHIGKGLRVLVVDSNQDSQEIITCFLESLNYQVFSVYSAIAALSAVKILEPDIMLSELLLPQRDGYWLMRSLRDQGCRIPAIAVTVAAMSQEREHAFAAGFNDHIAKPFMLNDLSAAVVQQCGD